MDDLLNKEFNDLGSIIFDERNLAFANAVAKTVSALKLNKEALAIAFYIKADVTKEDVRKSLSSRFGTDVLNRIELLQRIGRVSFPETQKQISDLRKMFINLSDDLYIIFIKLAERLEALKEAESMNSPELKNIAEECLYLYSPIAQRLGIYKFNTEMEDIAFRNLYPADFKYLSKLIEEKRELFNRKLSVIKAELDEMIKKYNITARFQSRVKRPYSIYRKLQNKKIKIDEIYDLLALRVITNTPENCYLTLGIVHSHWIPIEGRFRDWITFPKSNGYRSIQTTVHTRKGDKFEIQIRTEEMHHEAEYGSSAHWAYKQGPKDSELWVNRLKEFLENDEYFENPHKILDMLKTEMKRDYINVLTPKGNIISLPEGASALDYAFSVHTDLGYKAVGARVNGRFSKLKTELKSGDVVDITTSNNATPSRDWLSFVKTSRARAKILRWFKKNERDQLISEGKQAWERLKKQYRRKIEKFDDEPAFKAGLLKLDCKSSEEFFYGISVKNYSCGLPILRKFYPEAFKKAIEKKSSGGESSIKHKPLVAIEDLENIETSFAKCCSPIKGVPIIAYVTKRSGIKIHAEDCSFIKSIAFDPANFKKAEWLDMESKQTVRLKIFGENFGNMLAALVKIANDTSIPLVATNNLSQNKRSVGLYAELEVKDISQLKLLMNKLSLHHDIDSVKPV